MENTSDHEPIYCIMNVKTKIVAESVGEKMSKPSWKKASVEEKVMFQFLLEEKLSRISVPTQVTECRDLGCKDVIHLEAIDWFSIQTLNAIQEAGEEALPNTKSNTRKQLKQHLGSMN